MVAEPELRGQPGVVEGADEVVVALAEVSPAVVVDRDDHGRPQDRGRRGRPDAVQAQRAAPELARDARGAGVQDDRLDGRDAPGDLGDGPDRGVVPADVDGGQVRPGQDEADDLAVDEAIGSHSPSSGPWTAGTRSSMGGACRVPVPTPRTVRDKRNSIAVSRTDRSVTACI